MAIEEGTGDASRTDPRCNEEFVETVDAGRGAPIHLVGVVHDHPASAHRARTIVESHRVDVLALELSPIALPLFEAYADDPSKPPGLGGEFSAAVRAAGDAEVVGIDGPNRRFLTTLVRAFATGTHSASTVRRVLRGIATVTRQAAACRLAASVTRRTSLTVEVGERVTHECDRTDTPEAQAADEAAQVRRAESVLAALARPPAVRLRDETREESMARALDDLCEEGEVVAVVGVGHLDAVAERLRALDEERPEDGRQTPG